MSINDKRFYYKINNYNILCLVFISEFLILQLIRHRAGLHFSLVFEDPGSDLCIERLTDSGLRPAVDFGYIYGLLPVLIGHFWYRLTGLTIQGLALASIAFGVVIAWGFARFAHRLHVGWAGVALLMISMPFTIRPFYTWLTKGLEAALVTHALADHAGGKRSTALSLLTVACFVKPSMPLVLGFILLCFGLLDAWPRGTAGFLRLAAAPALTAVALGLLLGGLYGFDALLRTLLPLSGAALYKDLNFGFFHGIGRNFWAPPGANLNYYLSSVAGFWIAGTIVLTIASLWALYRWRRDGRDFKGEIIILCSLSHFLFFSYFFGNAWSWVHYFYIVALGLALIATYGRVGKGVVTALASLALVGNYTAVRDVHRQWTTLTLGPNTSGLFASEELRASWTHVLETIREEKAVLLARSDGAALLYPDFFAPPTLVYLHPTHALPAELNRKVRQISAASIVVVHTGDWMNESPDEYPMFAEALVGFEREWSDATFRVYRRRLNEQKGGGEFSVPSILR